MKKNLLKTLGVIVLLVVTGVYVYIRCINGGSPSPDSFFHLTQPWRFSNGDLPFVHEWHPSLLFGILITPLMSVYRLFGGGTSGILQHFNIISYALWFCACIFCWYRWRLINRAGACFGILAVMFLPPWLGCGMGYNCMGFLSVLTATTCYATNIKGSKMLDISSGVFCALAVLCCPHLAVVYALLTLWAIFKKNRRWLFVLGGTVTIALIFCGWLFSHVSLTAILDSLPGIMGDPEHTPRPVVKLAIDCVGHALFITHNLAFGHALLISAFGLTALVAFLDKKSREHATVYLATTFVLMSSLIIYYFIQPMVCMHVVCLPITIAALCVFCMIKDPRCKGLMTKGWLPALLYAIAISCSSNLGYYSMTFAMGVAIIPSANVIFMAGRKFWILFVPHFVAVILIMASFFMSFHAASLEREENGPARGYWLKPDYKAVYDQYWADTQELREDDRVKSILNFNHEHQWLNVSSDKQIAAYSSWLSGATTNSIERLKLYYSINPDRWPDAIFIPKDDYEAGKTFLSFGYGERVLPSGNVIMRRVAQ